VDVDLFKKPDQFKCFVCGGKINPALTGNNVCSRACDETLSKALYDFLIQLPEEEIDRMASELMPGSLN